MPSGSGSSGNSPFSGAHGLTYNFSWGVGHIGPRLSPRSILLQVERATVPPQIRLFAVRIMDAYGVGAFVYFL
jgi:hypothetical protein